MVEGIPGAFKNFLKELHVPHLQVMRLVIRVYRCPSRGQPWVSRDRVRNLRPDIELRVQGLRVEA